MITCVRCSAVLDRLSGRLRGLLPAALGLTKLYRDGESTDPSTTTDEEDALETLRERYAYGEIDEAEFERRLDALLETESVDEAADYTNREIARE